MDLIFPNNTNVFAKAKFERKPSGTIIVAGVEMAHTKQCCHCQTHFMSVKGSGKRRGFCTRCNAVTCGNLECDVCIPFEKKLDLMEK